MTDWQPHPQSLNLNLGLGWRSRDPLKLPGGLSVPPGQSVGDRDAGGWPAPLNCETMDLSTRGEGVRREQQAGSSPSLGEGPAVALDIPKNRTRTCGRGHLESSAAWRPGVRAVGSEVPTTVIIIVTTYESTVCQAFPEGTSGPLSKPEALLSPFPTSVVFTTVP